MLLMPEVSKTFHGGAVSENSVPFHESPLVGPVLSHTNPVMYALYMFKYDFNMCAHKSTHRPSDIFSAVTTITIVCTFHVPSLLLHVATL